MGFVGGKLGYSMLKRFWPGGFGGIMHPDGDVTGERTDKLSVMFGPGVYDELKGKVVLDFGCGEGGNAIELARQGCHRVIGLDIQENLLAKARKDAEAAGVADRCIFTTDWPDPVDVIISTDAFEHFADPEGILRIMRKLIKQDGYILVEFGYPWYHPFGGHLFSVFPWAHLVFTEKAFMRWRSDFKNDGATKFHECAGGLNKMSVWHWERMIAASPFRFLSNQLVPIRAARSLHNYLTRELLTSTIRARLVPR